MPASSDFHVWQYRPTIGERVEPLHSGGFHCLNHPSMKFIILFPGIVEQWLSFLVEKGHQDSYATASKHVSSICADRVFDSAIEHEIHLGVSEYVVFAFIKPIAGLGFLSIAAHHEDLGIDLNASKA